MVLLEIDEVARRLSVRRARAYELVRAGLLPSVRLGRQIRVSEEGLRKWVARGGCPLRQSNESEAREE
jgi:excisionase family DNA binding protein